MPRSSSDTRGKISQTPATFSPRAGLLGVTVSPTGLGCHLWRGGAISEHMLPSSGHKCPFQRKGISAKGAVSADLGSEAIDNFSEFLKTPSVLTSFCQPGWSRHTFLCATSFNSLSPPAYTVSELSPIRRLAATLMTLFPRRLPQRPQE